MADKKWETYEEVGAYLLDQFSSEFNLDGVEGKQKVSGKKTGTKWEIDGKGYKKDGDFFVIVECRRYTTSKQSQEKVGGLAYRIYDTGASGGIMVTSLGLQSGAELVTKAENIIPVKLTPDSNTKEYMMSFLNKLMIGVADEVKAGITDRAHIQAIENGKVVDERKA